MRLRLATAVLALVVAVSLFPAWAAPQPPPLSREQQLQDLEYLRSEYVPNDGAFDETKRQRAVAIIDRYERLAGSLSPSQLFLAAFEISAASDNGHSHAGWGRSPFQPSTRLPLKIEILGRSAIIVRALDPFTKLAGAEILAIDGRPIDQVYRALSRFLVSAPGSLAFRFPMLVEPGELLHAAGLATAEDKLTLRVRLSNGTRDTIVVPMVPTEQADGPMLPGALLSPAQGKGPVWASGMRATNLPMYLQDGLATHRIVRLPQSDTLYIQIKAQYDAAPGDHWAEFASRLRNEIAKGVPHDLIVDLRFDIGGDSSQTFDTFHDLAGQIPGNVYILTGPLTASAGIVTAAIFKKYAGNHAVVVGENVGDHLRFWSEISPKCMPNSKICVIANTGLWDLAKGCAGEPKCFGENDQYNVVVGDLRPQLPAPLTAAAYLAARDPAMEAIERDRMSDSRHVLKRSTGM